MSAGKYKDLSGQRFGRLTIVSRGEDLITKGGYKCVRWKCRCDCGNEVLVKTGDFKKVKSCGCWRSEASRSRQKLNLAGERFGSLTVIEENGYIRDSVSWDCICDCGNKRTVRSYDLSHGRITSCNQCAKERNHTQIYGGHRSKLYVCWSGMKRRCFNENDKNYNNYGGRGITVCEEWIGKNGFQNFGAWAYENGYDENAPKGECTIDRIDVNGNYEPNNCRWVNMKQQANNTRANKCITFKGETHTLSEWSEKTGISYSTLAGRFRNGWSAERALKEKTRGNKK